ncbi:hypothetical protein SH501x_001399 [Pirellulaceae bacterium SH501]
MILLAIVACIAAFLFWMLIPSKRNGTSPPVSPAPAFVSPFAPIVESPRTSRDPTKGPNEIAIDEKMRIIEASLRKKQAAKFESEVLAEAKELIEADE